MLSARTTFAAFIAAAAIIAISAPAHAHGWVLPPYSAAGGGGGGGPDMEPVVFEDVAGLGLGSTPGLSPARPGATPKAPGGSVGYGQASAGRARSKNKVAPWNHLLRIDWKPAFPVAKEGYGAQLNDPSAGLRVHHEEGGWKRNWQPSILVVWDPSLKHHRKAVANLEADARIRSASHLFNCFRMDQRSLNSKSDSVMLQVFDRKGKLLGEVSGQKRLHNVYDLLDSAVAKDGRKLSKVTPYLSSLLSGIAYCDHEMDWMGSKVICPDCGHERQDVLESLAQMKVRKEGLKLALEKVQGL